MKTEQELAACTWQEDSGGPAPCGDPLSWVGGRSPLVASPRKSFLLKFTHTKESVCLLDEDLVASSLWASFCPKGHAYPGPGLLHKAGKRWFIPFSKANQAARVSSRKEAQPQGQTRWEEILKVVGIIYL